MTAEELEQGLAQLDERFEMYKDALVSIICNMGLVGCDMTNRLPPVPETDRHDRLSQKFMLCIHIHT